MFVISYALGCKWKLKLCLHRSLYQELPIFSTCRDSCCHLEALRSELAGFCLVFAAPWQLEPQLDTAFSP